MAELTEKQSAILKMIIESTVADLCPPTIREIGAAFGISSTNGVYYHLHILITKGYLVRSTKRSARGINLSRQTREEIGLWPRLTSNRAVLALRRVEDLLAQGIPSVELSSCTTPGDGAYVALSAVRRAIEGGEEEN